MTAWVVLADVGTAAGTLVLAGATFVAVRAAVHGEPRPRTLDLTVISSPGSFPRS